MNAGQGRISQIKYTHHEKKNGGALFLFLAGQHDRGDVGEEEEDFDKKREDTPKWSSESQCQHYL